MLVRKKPSLGASVVFTPMLIERSGNETRRRKVSRLRQIAVT